MTGGQEGTDLARRTWGRMHRHWGGLPSALGLISSIPSNPPAQVNPAIVQQRSPRPTRGVERPLLQAALGEAAHQILVKQKARECRRRPDGQVHADGLEPHHHLRQQQAQRRGDPERSRPQQHPPDNTCTRPPGAGVWLHGVTAGC